MASLVSLRQDWSLAGSRLPVAQIELVGTAPEHRGNRLTERLFATLHQRHAADGVPVQIIGGIPYFYRRLGYDYALANDGAATVPAAALPAPEHDRPARSFGGLTVRAASVADADDLADGYVTYRFSSSSNPPSTMGELAQAHAGWLCP